MNKLTSIKVVMVAVLALTLAACESISYYTQAVRGQLYILSHRVDVQNLIENEETNPQLREQLQTILNVRAFAETDLNLPLKDNYDTYVDLQRRFVVWNVFAAPEFSMQAETWCYPIAGCVSYRGYFQEEKARAFSNDLKAEGLDTYVGGVAAYSTLGWFSDSVLNTVLNREDYQLASLIFHELAHQVIYVQGDTEFNESFATAVEREGLKRWLHSTLNEDESKAVLIQAQIEFERREQFVALVQDTVKQLEVLYLTTLAPQTMRERKAEIIDELKADYQSLKLSWNGYDAYDAWFSLPLNNAQLNTVATYYRWVSVFEIILASVNHDLPRFYAEVELISQLDSAERRLFLQTVNDSNTYSGL